MQMKKISLIVHILNSSFLTSECTKPNDKDFFKLKIDRRKGKLLSTNE